MKSNTRQFIKKSVEREKIPRYRVLKKKKTPFRFLNGRENGETVLGKSA